MDISRKAYSWYRWSAVVLYYELEPVVSGVGSETAGIMGGIEDDPWIQSITRAYSWMMMRIKRVVIYTPRSRCNAEAGGYPPAYYYIEIVNIYNGFTLPLGVCEVGASTFVVVPCAYPPALFR